MADHAKVFSASSFERLMLCPGSAVLAADAPRRSSQYSAEGTAIHAASASVLQGGAWPPLGSSVEADGFTFTWDADMEACGQAYVDYVQGLNGDTLLVEQRVAFGPALGVVDPEDGFGTADAIVTKGTELIVVDLKCGRGVEVQAGSEDGPNPQLACYAIGALAAVDGVLEDFETVRLVIVQPRLGGPSEHLMPKAALQAWAHDTAVPNADNVRAAIRVYKNAAEAVMAREWEQTYLYPTEKGCKFCPAKATCPALRDEVAGALNPNHVTATPEDFREALDSTNPAGAPDEPAWLSAALSKVDLIEDWCKAVRAEVERRLCEGQPVPGYKLVQGKKGPRAWADNAQAEEVLRKKMRLAVEDAYNLKLISPPQAEKLHKEGKIGPRQWPKLQVLIIQSEGKPHVAPESDPRPAITVAATPDDFI